MEHNNSESRGSYFPKCRKDANCKCDMCLASINATLDLMPMSAQRSTLTKLSSPTPIIDKTPISIHSTLMSTPVSRTPPVRVPPSDDLRSTAKSVNSRKVEVKCNKLRVGVKFWRWVLFVGLICGLEFGFSWGVSWVLRPALSRKIVKDVVEGSSGVMNVSERLVLIQRSLGKMVKDVSSCNLGDSSWRVNQWPEGRIDYAIREANSTWHLSKWSSSVVQLDPNTWLIEYRQSMLLQNPSIFLSAVEFLKFRVSRLVRKMKQEFWYLPNWAHYVASMSEANLSLPT